MRTAALTLVFASVVVLSVAAPVTAPATQPPKPKPLTIKGRTTVWNGKEYAPVGGVKIFVQRQKNNLHEFGEHWRSSDAKELDKRGLYEIEVPPGEPVVVAFNYSNQYLPDYAYLAAEAGAVQNITIGMKPVFEELELEKAGKATVSVRDKFRAVVRALPKNYGPKAVREEVEATLDKIGRDVGYTTALLVPGYFEDPVAVTNRDWQRVLDVANRGKLSPADKRHLRVPVWAVVNPHNGPGKEKMANYTAIVKQASAAGVRLLGYCHLREQVNGRVVLRDRATIQAEVKRWLKQYPEIEGIFFDEYPSQLADLAYCTQLRDDCLREFAAAKKPLPMLICNPGTECPREFIDSATGFAFCAFENRPQGDVVALPAWAKRGYQDRCGVLAYGVAQEDRAKLVENLLREQVGFVYVTDALERQPGVLNPWCRLPKDWDVLVKAVHEANEPKFPGK
jgi:hypothetical protein